MKIDDRLIFIGLPFLCGILFLSYLFLNWEKLGVELVGYHYLEESEPKKTFIIKNQGALLANYDLPTSDMFDQSRQRQLNFRYLSKDRLEKIRGLLPNSEYWLNKDRLSHVVIQNYPNAVSFSLAKKKIYLLAPPHAEQFAKFVEKEKIDRADVVSCTGSIPFCHSIKILAMGGISEVKDQILKVDTISHYLAPSGRWVSDELDIKFSSLDAKEIVVTGLMQVPFDKQSIMIKDPENSVYRILKNGPRLGEYPEYLGPFNFQVKLPLEKGETVLRIKFKNVTEKKSEGYIPKFSGVLTQLQLSPVS